MRVLRAEFALAVCAIIGALIYLWADSMLPATRIGDPLGPKAFPALVGGGLILSGLLLLLEIWKKRRSPEFARIQASHRAPVDKRRQIILCAMVAWSALYYAAFDDLGYLIATPIFLLGLLSHFHRGHHIVNVCVAVGFTGVVYALFSLFLGVPLPTGPLPI